MVRRTVRILVRGLALAVVLFLAMLGADTRPMPTSPPPAGPVWLTPSPAGPPAHAAEEDGTSPAALGAFLGSDADGVAAIDDFAAWLGTRVTVGHTYLSGNHWAGIEGPDWVLGPWSAWVHGDQGRLLVLNVPMVVPNEPPLPSAAAAAELGRGAAGQYDDHFRTLAQRLVAAGAPETILVPGWEMNGTTYSSRCSADPGAWAGYWRRIVAAMRSVPGQRFRFDFAPVRGEQAIDWARCYPGDDVVDIIGMDTYDQRPGARFEDYVDQPGGLRAQAEFAAEHGKPISLPEWGMFDYGDDPQYVQGMHDWIASHDVVYQTITDYCPHGVWECEGRNSRASARYRTLFGTGS